MVAPLFLPVLWRFQGIDAKVKPIPEEEDFARLRRGGGEDADLALAIRLQEEEMLTVHGRSSTARAERCALLRLPPTLHGRLKCFPAPQVLLYTFYSHLRYRACSCLLQKSNRARDFCCCPQLALPEPSMPLQQSLLAINVTRLDQSMPQPESHTDLLVAAALTAVRQSAMVQQRDHLCTEYFLSHQYWQSRGHKTLNTR